MERLTDVCWRNFDPWECCGQDHCCTRGCHDEGGCKKGCIVPRIYTRLASYEDTGLEPETVNDLLERFQSLYNMVDDLDLIDRVHFQAFLERVRRWTQAEKEGRAERNQVHFEAVYEVCGSDWRKRWNG